jgi:hypothetical protein
MCPIRNRSDWEDRMGAILPIAGALTALLILPVILAARA